ncbi:MAG TPA: beta-L-arabinofuranosidase domain-containing protein [Candidatus Saccharimonadales bacterium]|nr:beta-L-arabinofuranosidase domain-containing protein [Candidatus Saccharimonadales bacterium]
MTMTIAIKRMKLRELSILVMSVMIVCGARAAVQPAINLSVQQFQPKDAQLLDGPFKAAMDRDEKYLLGLDPDRLLSGFRSEAGLKPKAPKYGGWESSGLAGHTLGHYLSACSRMYQDTGNKLLLDRVNYIVAQLAECQEANSNGYIAAIPNGKDVFGKVAQGEIDTQGFGLNGGWSPWYTIHKELAGLIDAYRFCDNTQALAVATNLANWVYDTTKNLSDAQWQHMLVCEYGGMNEALANLYGLTGEPRYLDLAEKFYDNAVLGPLTAGHDDLSGKHDNTQVPKIIGSARLYELTGQPRYEDLARFYWQRVALHRSYVIGGSGDREGFFPTNSWASHLDAQTCETCCTYNILKLTLHLFEWSPSAEEMDFYERALYNDILASQDPDTGMFVYLMSLQPGGFKTYSTPTDSFWCCVGTGMENHSRYNQAIYLHDDDSLYVNLFIASELSWPEKGLTLRQDTKFPDKDTTRLTFHCKQPVKVALKIRWPGWAKTPPRIWINGLGQAVSGQPVSYITLNHEWRDGDVVKIRLPMTLHTEPLPGTTNLVAVLYGPIVLAGELGTKDMPANPYAEDQTKFVRWPPVPAPVFVADDDSLLKHIHATRQPLTFRTKNLGWPEDVTLVPFYDVQHQCYTVYWQVLSSMEWKQQEADIKARWNQQSARLTAWGERASAEINSSK